MDERRWEINQALTAAYMQYAAIEPKRQPVLTKVNSSIILFAGALLSLVLLAIVMFDKYQQQLKRAWMQERQEGQRAALLWCLFSLGFA